MKNPYESMLPRLARFAARHPRVYRARILALAALGYGVILGLLLLLIALELVLVAVMINTGELALLKLALPLLLFIGILVSALQIDIPAPKGMAVSRADAPALWAEIDRVRRAMRGPAPHQVLIDGELNASVTQVPRLGVLGFYRTYLTLGLPLAASLTTDELRAVLAHEYGHVSGKHGRLGVWIHRVRTTWTEVLADLEHEGHWTTGLFRAFLRWYAPYFDAYTAVLQRAHEFEADRAAARIAGTATAATALCRLDVAAGYVETVFWPAVHAHVARGPMAPTGVYRQLLLDAPGAARHDDAPSWLDDAAARRTRPWDTHPALSERLASLGATAAVPAATVAVSAATELLGAQAEKLADRLSRRWTDMAQISWRDKHEEHLRMAQRLAALEEGARARPLDPGQARDRILLTVQLHGQTVAIPLMRTFVDEGQNDATVHLLLGRALLEEGDDAGMRHLERAMELDVDTVPAASASAARFLGRQGCADEAGAFRQRGEAHALAVEDARHERAPSQVAAGDLFLPHALDAMHVRTVAAQLANAQGLRRAVLVRKQVVALEAVPCHVLALEPQPWLGSGADGPNAWRWLAEDVLKLLKVEGTVTVVLLKAGSRLDRSLSAVRGSELYRAAASASAAPRARAGAR